MDLAEAAHKARMSIGLGDEQLDVDDLGRMDDRPRQAAAQSPGGVDRWEAANVSQRALGDVMLERGDGVRPGASLVDRGGDAGMNPSIVRRQAEGGHPFEDVACRSIQPAVASLPSSSITC